MQNSYSCEKICDCPLCLTTPPRLVVLTGGPGAGKTAVLELMRKLLCEHVALIPEAASILFNGGFARLPSDSARQCAQRAIYHIQCEMQNLVIGEKKWALGICDRGTLDGVAYWPGNPTDFEHDLRTTRQAEYAKYAAVIHLSSPDRKGGYNYQNPLRTESAEEAAAIDHRIQQVWHAHPHYHHITSTGDFFEKVQAATALIHGLLPACCANNLQTTEETP